MPSDQIVEGGGSPIDIGRRVGVQVGHHNCPSQQPTRSIGITEAEWKQTFALRSSRAYGLLWVMEALSLTGPGPGQQDSKAVQEEGLHMIFLGRLSTPITCLQIRGILQLKNEGNGSKTEG